MKRIYTCLFILLLGCIVCPLRAVTLDEARKYINEKDYEKAVEAFRSLMKNKSYAQRADCNKWYGEALCMTGNYEEAIPFLEKSGKRQVKGAYWYLGICFQKLYDFEAAIEALNKYKSLMKNSEKWNRMSDSIIAECEVGLRALSHVEDVEIIDSLVVPKNNFFEYYRLGYESGRIVTVGEASPIFEDSLWNHVAFESQAKDYRLVVRQDTAIGKNVLYESDFFDGQWSNWEPVASISVASDRMGFPFLRTDGETLYFSADQPSGMGGLDIYVAHYDSEEDTYYTPERLGMPFNSPYDDYLMAIDETHQVGWWATERRGVRDSVVIYLFKLSESPTYLDGVQVGRGRIDALNESWKEGEDYADLLHSIKNAEQIRREEKQKLQIVINDKNVYNSADQFKSKDAKALYEQSSAVASSIRQLESELDRMRTEWATASTTRKAQLRPLILQREHRLESQREQLETLQKGYRNAESKML